MITNRITKNHRSHKMPPKSITPKSPRKFASRSNVDTAREYAANQKLYEPTLLEKICNLCGSCGQRNDSSQNLPVFNSCAAIITSPPISNMLPKIPCTMHITHATPTSQIQLALFAQAIDFHIRHIPKSRKKSTLYISTLKLHGKPRGYTHWTLGYLHAHGRLNLFRMKTFRNLESLEILNESFRTSDLDFLHSLQKLRRVSIELLNGDQKGCDWNKIIEMFHTFPRLESFYNGVVHFVPHDRWILNSQYICELLIRVNSNIMRDTGYMQVSGCDLSFLQCVSKDVRHIHLSMTNHSDLTYEHAEHSFYILRFENVRSLKLKIEKLDRPETGLSVNEIFNNFFSRSMVHIRPGIASMHFLKVLVVDVVEIPYNWIDGIKSLYSLEELTLIERSDELNASRTDNVLHLSKLKKLEYLRTLHMQCTVVRNMSMENLYFPHLVNMTLNYWKLTGIPKWAHVCPHLKNLSILGCKIDDFKFFSKVRHIEILNMNFVDMDVSQFEYLKDLRRLRSIKFFIREGPHTDIIVRKLLETLNVLGNLGEIDINCEYPYIDPVAHLERILRHVRLRIMRNGSENQMFGFMNYRGMCE